MQKRNDKKIQLKCNVLIVDDEKRNLIALESLLEDIEGIRIIQARSGRECLKHVLEFDFAVILMDINMPGGLDGFETASLVRQRKRSKETPIIFVTAHQGERLDVDRGYAIGAVDYIIKPINQQILLTKVGVFVNLFRKTKEIAHQAEEAQKRALMLEELNRDLKAAEEKVIQTSALAATAASKAASARYIESILQSLTDLLFVVDYQGIIKTVNKSALQILGYFENELLNRSLGVIIAEEEEEEEEEDSFAGSKLQQLIKKDMIRDYPSYYRSKSGEKIPVAITGTVIRNANLEITDIVLSAKDLRDSRMLKELKSTQAQLVQAAKLASLGEMSSGLAHELNNPLSLVSGFAGRIVAKFADNPTQTYDDLKVYIGQITANANRMRNIIIHFREFSRQADHKFITFSIDEVVEKSFILLEEDLRLKNIRVEKNHIAQDVLVKGDPNRIEQVIVNLLTNARDACNRSQGKGGGTLKVSVENVDGKALIKIEDDGPGIPIEIRDRIFDPFFTTKEVGKGTGLGLSISYGIIKEHNGSISMYSDNDKGTVFTIILPLFKAERGEKAA